MEIFEEVEEIQCILQQYNDTEFRPFLMPFREQSWRLPIQRYSKAVTILRTRTQ